MPGPSVHFQQAPGAFRPVSVNARAFRLVSLKAGAFRPEGGAEGILDLPEGAVAFR